MTLRRAFAADLAHMEAGASHAHWSGSGGTHWATDWAAATPPSGAMAGDEGA